MKSLSRVGGQQTGVRWHSAYIGRRRLPLKDGYARRVRWDEFVDAAQAISWTVNLGTADVAGVPHVSVVATGFTEGSLWFATNRTSKKIRNLRANPSVAFHWPLGGGGPGELVARGSAVIHDSEEDRRRLWAAGIMPYDLGAFFGSPDNESMVFVEVLVESARLLGPDFVADRWVRDPISPT